jgi:hypothetical protein
MTDPTTATRAQELFLESFRQSPTGPAPADWPTPGVLRRWLKDRRFKKALTATRDAIRLQTDFHLASAASSAARALQTTITPATSADLDPTALADLYRTLKSLTDLLRLAHLRERFTTERPRPAAAPPKREHNILGNEENRRILAGKGMNYYEKCLNDAKLLKDLLLWGVLNGGGDIYDQFLVSFPEELAKAHETYDRYRRKHAAPAAPQPDTNPTTAS